MVCNMTGHCSGGPSGCSDQSMSGQSEPQTCRYANCATITNGPSFAARADVDMVEAESRCLVELLHPLPRSRRPYVRRGRAYPIGWLETRRLYQSCGLRSDLGHATVLRTDQDVGGGPDCSLSTVARTRMNDPPFSGLFLHAACPPERTDDVKKCRHALGPVSQHHARGDQPRIESSK